MKIEPSMVLSESTPFHDTCLWPSSIWQVLEESGNFFDHVMLHRPLLLRLEALFFGSTTAGCHYADLSCDHEMTTSVHGSTHAGDFQQLLHRHLRRSFDDVALAEQPSGIVHVDCRDFRLMHAIYACIRDRTARGRALGPYPLIMVGMASSAQTLDSISQQLAKHSVPHVTKLIDSEAEFEAQFSMAVQSGAGKKAFLYVYSSLELGCCSPDDASFRGRGIEMVGDDELDGAYVSNEGNLVAPGDGEHCEMNAIVLLASMSLSHTRVPVHVVFACAHAGMSSCFVCY